MKFSTGFKPKDAKLALHCDIECSSTKYVKVKGNRSYYDGDFVYWSKRLAKHPETTTRIATFLKKQKGKCTECGHYFKYDDVMEVDHIIPKSLGGKNEYKNYQLLHGHCHDHKSKVDGSLDTRKANLKAKDHRDTKLNKPMIK